MLSSSRSSPSRNGSRAFGWLALAFLVWADVAPAWAEADPRGDGSVELSTRAAEPTGREWTDSLVAAAHERTRHRVTYDGRYRRLAYPGGDVPDSVGVCTDVVIRAYRAVGVDLQRLVHEDMRDHFAVYPDEWGLTRPDSNIDHRRVPNLRVFFSRHGESLPVTHRAADYQPGDLVTWKLDGRLPHIGLVVDGRSRDGLRPLIVHNIGRGPRKEDVLFAHPITGHYRFGSRSRDRFRDATRSADSVRQADGR